MRTSPIPSPALFLCTLALAASASPAQEAAAVRPGALHPHMVRLLEERGPSKGWVFFRDKGILAGAARSAALAEAARGLTPRALQRRVLRRTAPGVVDERDLPVHAEHVRAVLETGAELSVESRWLNAISVRGTIEEFRAIAALPFVERIEPVRRGVLVDGWDEARGEHAGRAFPKARPVEPAPPASSGTFYGASEAQLDQIGILDLHTRGHTADGIVIGILDTGFHRGHEAFNQPGHVVDVIAEYDFVDDDGDTGIEGGDPASQHSHGTYILGTLAAYLPTELVGAAYDASFVLAKTEDTTNEYEQEEDFYVAGLEFIEMNGADLATSSLGYIDWYTQADLDGLTAVTTICVNVATTNGLHCCTAAGNSGHDANAMTSALIAPADAFEVITAGAVDSTGTIAGFSSDGPTADTRVKPELLAWGVSTATVCAFTDVNCTTSVSGTSLSTPLLAGLVACLADAHPAFTVGQMRSRLFQTGDYFVANATTDPLYVLGYGIPDGDDAGFDCNANAVDDDQDLLDGTECDCNQNGWPDSCDIADGISLDADADGRPDECAQLLSATPATISLSAGGSQAFCLDAGPSFAGYRYVLAGSASGTSPGLSFGGATLPLNRDAYLFLTLRNGPGSPLSAATGVLDSQGRATAELVVPPGSSLFVSGATVHHAFAAWSPSASGTGAFQLLGPAGLEVVSNAASLQIVP